MRPSLRRRTALLATIVEKLSASGVAARIAVADTPGAAWAVARYGARQISVVAEGEAAAALHPLPIAALRVAHGYPDGPWAAWVRPDRAARGGSTRTGALRFGALLMRRLDEAMGRLFEPLAPVFPPETVADRLPFVEPLSTAEAFVTVIGALTKNVCKELERRSLGARQVDLVFERVDGSHQIIRVGAARPARNPHHLARMLGERVDQVDPGLGVDAMQLIVTLADRLTYTRHRRRCSPIEKSDPDIAALVDRLVNRWGRPGLSGGAH